MAEYIRFGNKKLRKGYTTGTSAAGAAKAGALMLLDSEELSEITVNLPQGKTATLPLAEIKIEGETATCAITKDGGDDPDITTGINIYAQVILNKTGIITIDGGKGVGRVTQKGLKMPIGEAAINPVPRSMIKDNLLEILPKGYGAEVTVFVPQGEEIAKKTFNPKLGIVGGISILGSTGIVNPMSEDALMESIALELNIIHEKGFENVIFAFGNYGMDFLRSLEIDESQVVKISNYIGFMLDKAMDMGFKKILLSGHIGKLVKVAGGIFNTHSKKADCRMEILAAYAGLEGASTEIIQEIYQGKTTSAALDIIEEQGLTNIYKRIVDNTTKLCESYTYNEIEIGTILFGYGNLMLYMDEKDKDFLKELHENGK
ncbi:MAG: cobalt-precorrin-5B (C(1))-methyltransferase CbiD [Clostridiales bacterium]